mgnify:FL=1|tara:strand:- start:432 stop:731 length:300 start_codon:yes stop_codon:yes gene_type:complete
MDTGLGFIEEVDKLTEIKNSSYDPIDKIRLYKDYLLNDCNYRLPDVFLEFVAREKLDLKYTEEEINNMKQQYHRKKEITEEQDFNYEKSLLEEEKLKIL